MPKLEHFDVVILGSGQGGKLLAWHLGRSGKRLPLWSGVGSAARARPWPVCHPRMYSGARGSPILCGPEPISERLSTLSKSICARCVAASRT